MLKLYKDKLLIGIYIFLIMISFMCGWKSHTYYDGYKLSIQQQIQKTVDDGFQKIQQNQAQNLQQTLDAVNKKQDTIIKEVPKIINRPIYVNQCIDQDGLNALKEMKENSLKYRSSK